MTQHLTDGEFSRAADQAYHAVVRQGPASDKRDMMNAFDIEIIHELADMVGVQKSNLKVSDIITKILDEMSK